MSQDNNRSQSGSNDRLPKRILATGAALSLTLGVVLVGLSIVISSLNGVKLTLELKKEDQS